MIDRDFGQVSEEHMKSMTKQEGPAQEPQMNVEQWMDDAAAAILDVLMPPKGRDWSAAAREVIGDVIARQHAASKRGGGAK